MKSHFRIIALTATGTLLLLTACQRKGCTDPAAVNYSERAKEEDGTCFYDNPDKPNLFFHIHRYFNGEALKLEQEYADSTGRKIVFTDVRFYLSGFQAGSSAVPASYALIRPGKDGYPIGDVDAGTYDELRFSFGLDPDANHSDPATYDPEHPLAPQTPSMNWGWETGYKFLILEGKVDTTAAANGTPDALFSFHIGTDEMLRKITVEGEYDLTQEDAYYHMDLDFARFLDGIDLRIERTSHTTDNPGVARKIADNAASVFSPADHN